MKSELELVACIGIDWADEKHAVCLKKTDSDQVKSFSINHRPEELHAWIRELGREFQERKVGIAIEQSRGSVIHALMQYEFLVLYPINPKILAKYRQSVYVSGAKDDIPDAALLLDLIVSHRDRFRPWIPDTAETRKIQLLSEYRRTLVDDQTGLTNRLESLLKAYFPQALEWAGALDTIQACDFLKKWRCLDQVQKAKPGQLRTFYTDHGCRRPEVVEKRIDAIRCAQPLTTDKAVIECHALMVGATVAQLRPLIAEITRFDRESKSAFEQHPDHELYESFPGAGEVMEPRLLAAMGSDRSRFETADEVERFSGIAPVTKRSGKMHFVHRRYACPTFVRQTFHEWAGFTVVYSTWAAAFYEYKRSTGMEHHAALRELAYKWIRIVFRCWKDGVLYDEQIYLTSLRRKKPRWAVQSGLVAEVA